MKKLSFIAVLLMGSILAVNAQNEMQALRFSQYNPFGTARYAAQGGAIGALGGDSWPVSFLRIFLFPILLLGQYKF